MTYKTFTRSLIPCVVMLCGEIATGWAGGPAREADSGNLFVWIFLAFCALIVVLQLIPALMMFLGFARGTRRGLQEAVPVSVKDGTNPSSR